jgi:hypothetical protein
MAKQVTKNDTTKAAVLSLLSRGLITKSEAALLAGVSKQLVQHWSRDIDCHKARSAYMAAIWSKATKRRY